MLSKLQSVKDATREAVQLSYRAAEAANKVAFLTGDSSATSEYTYPNQREDAKRVIDQFCKHNRRVVSITKKTKVGMNGLIIEISKMIATIDDDNLVVDPANIRILTGMSSTKWEKELTDTIPSCFKHCVYHHGKLRRSNLVGLKQALIIIDELDNASGIDSVLDNELGIAGMLDITYMEENNIRFVLVSATMIKQLNELKKWGDRHVNVQMTIPDQYIGHADFLDRDIIQESYPIKTGDDALQWIKEDILDNYGEDYRVHLIRVTPKSRLLIKEACEKSGIYCRDHTSEDRLSDEEIYNCFESQINSHIVILLKGLFRRANLIPNIHKLRIGATHELWTSVIDNNVQVQGLPGRMSGYWRDAIEGGHKTGPYRASIKSIEEYCDSYDDPFGSGSYRCAGFTKNKRGKINITKPSLVSSSNIDHMCVEADDDQNAVLKMCRIFANEDTVRKYCAAIGYQYRTTPENALGFRETSLNAAKQVVSLTDAINKVSSGYGTNKGTITYRTCYPCYTDVADKSTLRFVVIIRPGTDIGLLAKADAEFL